MSTPTEFPSLALIRQGVDYRFKIRCRNLELSVRPLSIYEEDQVIQRVASKMEESPEHLRTSLRQTMLLAINKLEMAQSDEPNSLNGVKVHAAELQMLTPGELDHLFKQYISHCDKVNPMLERLNKADLEQVVERLKKNSSVREMTLIESSFFHLVDISLHLLSTGDSPTGN